MVFGDSASSKPPQAENEKQASKRNASLNSEIAFVVFIIIKLIIKIVRPVTACKEAYLFFHQRNCCNNIVRS